MTSQVNASITDTAALFDVKGLVAVVTGGATGIGLMMATTLECKGAIVYIVGRRKEALDKAVRERSRHGNLIALQGDITDRDALRALAAEIKSRHGYINLLVNNAGVILGPQPKLPTPAEVDITAYQELLWNAENFDTFGQTFRVNVSAAWFCTVAFLELLHAGNMSEWTRATGTTSQVLTTSSIGGFRRDSAVFSISYTLSKGAATQLGRMIGHYLKDWKIRSNVIAPGIFPSEMADGMISDTLIKSTVPAQRVGGIDDMGGLLLFLASRAGAYVDGGIHVIDGGRLINLPALW
ncbi:uncharacterized protein FIBRA_03047 [Fibroporia radiculosa]|uniref:NAD-P-binding protein n=1 Tax=Fibroporia radiculosa TaxID=599839 RepID=J4H268_9APHY|nr:uncharacterized protein FIBRA_03047 [Fibroporia radiculosa]CCM00999.1 predicted protein [Fibroporia radiculosa]